MADRGQGSKSGKTPGAASDQSLASASSSLTTAVPHEAALDGPAFNQSYAAAGLDIGGGRVEIDATLENALTSVEAPYAMLTPLQHAPEKAVYNSVMGLPMDVAVYESYVTAVNTGVLSKLQDQEDRLLEVGGNAGRYVADAKEQQNLPLDQRIAEYGAMAHRLTAKAIQDLLQPVAMVVGRDLGHCFDDLQGTGREKPALPPQVTFDAVRDMGQSLPVEQDMVDTVGSAHAAIATRIFEQAIFAVNETCYQYLMATREVTPAELHEANAPALSVLNWRLQGLLGEEVQEAEKHYFAAPAA